MLTKTHGSGCSVISRLYKESEHKLVSKECRRLGITEQVLHDILNSKQECENESESTVCSLAFGNTPVITVTNKLVIELSEIRKQMGKSWVELLRWLQILSNKHGIETADGVRRAVERILNHKRELIHLKKKEECNQFLGEEFIFPQNKLNESVLVDSDPMDEYKISLDLQAKEIEALVSELEQSSNEIEMLHQLIREQSAISIAKANEVENMRGNLHISQPFQYLDVQISDVTEQKSGNKVIILEYKSAYFIKCQIFLCFRIGYRSC